MKILRKIFLVFVSILLVLSVSFYIFVQLKGKALVLTALKSALGDEVVVSRVGGAFPFGVVLYDVALPGKFRSKEVEVHLGIPDLLKKHMVLSKVKLIKPMVIVERAEDSKIVLGKVDGLAENFQKEKEESSDLNIASADNKNIKMEYFKVFVKKVKVVEGVVEFFDYAPEKDRKIVLENVYLNAKHIEYPLSDINTTVEASAKVVSGDIPFSGSNVYVRGMVNIKKKDMDAKVEFVEPDGRIGLSASLKSVNNNMKVDGVVDFTSLDEDNIQEEPKDLGGFIAMVVNSSGLEVSMSFSFETKMDSFSIDNVPLKGMVRYSEDKASEEMKEDLKALGKSFENFGKKFYKEKSKISPEK